jgi:pyridoxamine 5'-phosphate oxidase
VQGADPSISRFNSEAPGQTEGRTWLRKVFPDLLPTDPLPLLTQWFDEAAAAIHDTDFNAMALATASSDGIPSVRMVLCKRIESSPPAAVFFTNYGSRKGRELEANPRAAAVLYWPGLKRQARLEGTVVRTTNEESDEYFSSRPRLSRIGAIASAQSRPLSSRATLVARVVQTFLRPEAAAHRPADWGGYRILLHRIELWSAGGGRLHDRIEWTRVLDSVPPHWTPVRLFP